MIRLFKFKRSKSEERSKQLAARADAMRTDTTQAMTNMVKNIQHKKCKKAHP